MPLKTLDTLNQRGLAAIRVDREHCNAVFATGEDLFAAEFHCAVRAIGGVYETAVRMHVDRTGGLVHLRVALG